MRAIPNVIFHPSNLEEVKALKALGKVLKMNFEVKTEKKPLVSKEKQKIMDDIKEAVNDLNLIHQGKLKARPFNELLDEL